MSAHENVDVVLEAFSAIERRDDQRFLDLLHPDFEILWPPSLPYGESSPGPNDQVPTPVVVSDTGQLGIVASSERFKKDIATMDKASEAILSLRPVTFQYKTDTKGTPQFGLIAEEVAKVNPALVLPDKEGKPYTVRYDAVNAMLLNEFLKEHRENEEQEKTIAELKSGMTALAATVKEQASQIQKVSAQLDASKPAPQVVKNP